MRREITLSVVVLAAAACPLMAQNPDQSAEMKALRAEIEQLETELKACAADTQSVNATLQRRVVWMPESQARAMGLTLWQDANGNTPRIPMTAGSATSGVSQLSQSAPVTLSTSNLLAPATTVLSSQVLPSQVAGTSVIAGAPIQTFNTGTALGFAPSSIGYMNSASTGFVAASSIGYVNSAGVGFAPSSTGCVNSGAGFVPSTAPLGMDNNPYLQDRLDYYRSSWVARSPAQAYETVQFRGTAGSTTPNASNPYVIYPWQARWTTRQ